MTSTIVVLLVWFAIITAIGLFRVVINVKNDDTWPKLIASFIVVCIDFAVLYLSIQSIVFLVK